MSGVFWATYVVLWIFVVSLLFAVLLLYRQFGLMLMPGRKRMSLDGLDVGAAAPSLALTFSDAKEPQIVEWGSLPDAETTSWVLPMDGGVLTQDGEVMPMRQTGEPSATGRPEGR